MVKFISERKRIIMKKVLFGFLLLSITMFSPAMAETMAVQSITAISTETPEQIIKVKVVRDCTLGDITLKTGYILEGKMMSVTDPKRLKQNASFTFAPLTYFDLNGNPVHIPKLYIGTYSPKFEIDSGKVAKSAALTVGNHFVKGVSAGYYAVEGAVQNTEGNRFKSAAENVYENSLFSYVEKGEQLHIEKDTCFGLKFDECINEKDKN